MPHYLFHVTNGNQTYQVEVRHTFSTSKAASAHAASIAGKLAEDDDWEGFGVSVVDDRGNEIARVPIHP